MPKEELKSPQRRTLTRRLIREALLELLKTQNIRKISVRELCDAAGVNRTTFYNHYNDTRDVLAEIEEKFIAQLSEETPLYAGPDGLERHIELLCTRLQNNREVAIILMENNADPHFFDKLMTARENGSCWQQLSSSYTVEEITLLQDFLSNGAYAMLLCWLKGGCRQSPGQIAGLMSRTIQQGVALK